LGTLQAAEFLATESPDFFWGYVKAFNDMPADSLRYRSDKDMYELVLEVAARFLTPSQLDILRLQFSHLTLSHLFFTSIFVSSMQYSRFLVVL
jgi:hypothetical protein